MLDYRQFGTHLDEWRGEIRQTNQTFSVGHDSDGIVQWSVSVVIKSEHSIFARQMRAWETLSGERDYFPPSYWLFGSIEMRKERPIQLAKRCSSGNVLHWEERGKERTSLPSFSFLHSIKCQVLFPRHMHTKIRTILSHSHSNRNQALNSPSSTFVPICQLNSKCFFTLSDARTKTTLDDTCVFYRETILNRSDHHRGDDVIAAGSTRSRKRRAWSLSDKFTDELRRIVENDPVRYKYIPSMRSITNLSRTSAHIRIVSAVREDEVDPRQSNNDRKNFLVEQRCPPSNDNKNELFHLPVLNWGMLGYSINHADLKDVSSESRGSRDGY